MGPQRRAMLTAMTISSMTHDEAAVVIDDLDEEDREAVLKLLGRRWDQHRRERVETVDLDTETTLLTGPLLPFLREIGLEQYHDPMTQVRLDWIQSDQLSLAVHTLRDHRRSNHVRVAVCGHRLWG